MTGVIAGEAKERNLMAIHPRVRANATMKEKASTVIAAATVFRWDGVKSIMPVL